MDAHKSMLATIVNTFTIVEVSFFKDRMFGRKTFGKGFKATWNL